MPWRSFLCPQRPSIKEKLSPASLQTCLPDATSQTRTVSSLLALTTFAPSPLNVTWVTVYSCPVSVCTCKIPQIQNASNA
jgi:hypothetical protein